VKEIFFTQISRTNNLLKYLLFCRAIWTYILLPRAAY